ncbi:hypothetical protein CROQUDRAFT_56531 [Cronartium quercuum f. sp. fusiforme G11]|uniref:Uncharacterized protein n=1 Tax=Cronartium quercuum f. sp. fusiforme G11 TaxID=708437 RepID=A0A9P6TIC2_9BASI|nr:hypothetical protein CROQUDRAFT_56531 [Cronartium quercuum f. sp. fusiforme G11]
MPERQILRPLPLGRAGEPIEINVNAYHVTLVNRIIYQYTLSIQGFVGRNGVSGDVPPNLGRKLFRELQDQVEAFGNDLGVAYDGRKNLYSVIKFDWPNDRQSFVVELSEGEEIQKLTVVLVKVNNIYLDNLFRFVKGHVGSSTHEGILAAITALNVLCNHDLMMRHSNAKNKFFPVPTAEGPQLKFLGRGIEMWRGYFFSLRMVPNGFVVNFDLSCQPMIRSGNLAEVAAEIAGLGRNVQGLANLRPQAITRLTRILGSVKVTVKRADGTKFQGKVKQYGPLNARTHTFTIEEEGKLVRMISVETFFKERYGTELHRPELPVVQVSAKAWYPIELCHIEPGQRFRKKIDPELFGDAIRWLSVKPVERTRMLSEGVARHLSTSVLPRQWGLTFNPKPMVIQARHLPPPVVNHKNRAGEREATRVVNGVWSMVNRHVYSAAPPLINWVAVVFAGHFRFDSRAVMKALGDLRTSLIITGMAAEPAQHKILFAVGDDQPVPNTDGKDDNVGKWIMSHLEIRPQLIICFLKDKNAWQYRQLKIFGDTVQGVPSQCLSIDKVLSKGNSQYYSNVSLKMFVSRLAFFSCASRLNTDTFNNPRNAKLGGMNHVIGSTAPFFCSLPTMVMGADVTHPGEDSIQPSIAGVVGSTNEHGLGYAPEFSVQPSRQEIIGELDILAEKLLVKYHDCNGVLPQRIIFYRDGVSEAQFPHVITQEIPLLRRAMEAVKADTKLQKATDGPITLTFIVCGKRHHFKFCPTNPMIDGDRNGNCLAGVVVDRGIVHPFKFDWYGLSHAAVMGTSRSSHYTVLIDDANHSADDLQTITYHLCYLYSRATRSVSIATPVYYAHHICTRIKQFLSTVNIPHSNGPPTQHHLNTVLNEYQAYANQYKAGFDMVYLKTRSTNPVPEFWM